MTENEDRTVNMLTVHEIKHLQATLNVQMKNLIGSKIDPALRLKVLRKLMFVEAALVIEIAKVEANTGGL